MHCATAAGDDNNARRNAVTWCHLHTTRRALHNEPLQHRSSPAVV